MMKKLLFLFGVLCFTKAISQTSPADMVLRMGRGLNLGNVLSAPSEGNWSPAAEQQYFIDVATEGFTNVRIPIDFYGNRTTGDTSIYSDQAGTSASYNGSPSDYVVNASYLDRLEEVINWGLDQGLVITLDFHGGGLKSEFIYTFKSTKSEYTHPTSAKRAADNEKFETIWTQIADRFKNYSYDLLFEIINEPYFYMSKPDMDTLNTNVLSIIRNSGGNNANRNVIITGGGATSHEAPLQIEPTILNNDNYLIPTFHYYQPFDFTASSADSRDNTDWGNASDKSILSAEFDEVSTWANSHNVSIFVGEFGTDNTGGYKYSTGDLNTVGANTTGYADGGPDNTSRVEFHRYVAQQSINRGFSFAAWDSGPKSNKTIHKRTDSPLTVNYDINYFSVNSYDPKDTNISTVIDNTVWVEDVKEALLDTSTNCNNAVQLVMNPNFECGYNSSWSLTTLGGTSATFNNGAAQSYSGNSSAKIQVNTSGNLNQVILKNQTFTGDLNDKKIDLSGFAKVSGGSSDIKVRFKSIVYGSNDFVSSTFISLNNAYSPFNLEYLVAPGTTSVEFQIICGQTAKTYFFDDINFTIEDVNILGAENSEITDSQFIIYPMPLEDKIHINTNLNLESFDIFNLYGKKIKSFEYIETNQYDISVLQSGIYFININKKNGKTFTEKIIVK